MSSYATLWKLIFPRDGDDYLGCEWITVIAQGVPLPIGAHTPEDGYEDGEYAYMQEVVFVIEDTSKGTGRSPQEYVQPLLVLTGEEYANMRFETLYTHICNALRGNKPRVVAQYLAPGGRIRILFEDGTAKEVDV
ncbi:MAG TPA: hypothetical protein VIH59_37195 [Candidatus Tectomicrobia bacterium]|jgi:hypothetical protein